MDDMMAVIIIGICVFAFLGAMLGIGQFYGGEWNIIAQGVAKFILLIVAFSFGCFVLVRLANKR
jgi:TM2 domain-containing membrane protein YozV